MKNLIILTIILFTVQFLAPIYAQTEQKPRLIVQTGHTNSITSVAVSPDGKIAASGGYDNSVKIWNIKTGQQLNSLDGHKNWVNSVAFSPDGKTLASSGLDDAIKIWNVETGKEIKTLNGHTDSVNSVIFSPDGKFLASGSSDKTIRLWNIKDGLQIKSLVGHNDSVNSIAFSSDGKIIASGSFKVVKLWNVESGQQIKSIFAHSDSVNSISFSPDGKMLCSGSYDKTIKVWNIESDQEIISFKGHESAVNSVVFSPDGKLLASGSGDKTIKLWSLEKKQEIKTFTGHSSSVYSIIFSPNGKTLVSGSGDKTIKIWDIETSDNTRSFDKHSSWLNSVAVSQDGKLLVAGSYDHTVKVWSLESGRQINSLVGHTDLVYSVVISPDGKKTASISADDTLKLWDTDSGQIIKSIPENGHILALSPDGKTLASGGGRDNSIELWNIETGQLIKNIVGHDESIISFNFSPDGNSIASGSHDNKVKIWDIKTGEEIINFSNHKSSVGSVVFSPDGKIIASGSVGDDNTIRIWRAETGEEIRTFSGIESSSLSFSSNGKILVSANYDETVKSWDTETWEQTHSLSGHNNNIHSIAFIKDSKILISASEDATMKVWNIEVGKLIATLTPIGLEDWIATTADGRFDTNKLEKPEGLHWIMPDAPFTPLTLEVFMRDYFEPNLLPRLLRCNEESNCEQEFKPVRDLSSLNRTQPKIEIKNIGKADASGVVEVTVEAENVKSEFQKGAGGKFLDSGVFDLRLFRDGQLVGNSTSDADLRKTFRSLENFDEELKVWRETNKVETAGGKKTFTFRVKLPNDALNKPVEFSAYAFNDDRVKSETSRMTFTIDEKTVFKPKLRRAYLLTFGVNRYENSAWDLQFAGNDARAMREIVGRKLRDGKQFEDVIEIPLISDDEMVDGKIIQKRDAVKANIRTALELLSGKSPDAADLKSLERAISAETLAKIKQANPDDMVLISFSSHGYADRNGIFYILPTDIGADSDRKIDEKMLTKFISSDELSLWLRDVDAGEMVMIVDACYADAFKGKDFKPAPMGSRGLGQLAFDKGMRILSATQAANVAIETGGTIGHGLLTYALLNEGLEKTDADFKAQDRKIDVREWLEFAEFRVPNLYVEITKGKLKAVGKAKAELIQSANQKRNDSTQRPSLFDFTRKSKTMVLTDLQ